MIGNDVFKRYGDLFSRCCKKCLFFSFKSEFFQTVPCRILIAIFLYECFAIEHSLAISSDIVPYGL